MSGFFKSKEPEVKTTFEQPEQFKTVTKRQGEDIAGRIGQPGPAFEGQRVAPLTSLQQTGIQKAQEFAGAPLPNEFNLARDEFVRQLTPTDPSNTFLFKAIQEGARRNLRENIEQISDISGGTNRAFSGARLEQESKAVEGATINLNQILGQLALEQEKQRISAAERLPGIAEQIAGFPLRQAEAAVGIGDIERQVEQAGLDAQFQEFIRRFVETPQNVGNLANQFISQGAPTPVTTVNPGQISPFASTVNFGKDLAVALAGSLGGGGGGGGRTPDAINPAVTQGGRNIGGGVTSQGIRVPSRVQF